MFQDKLRNKLIKASLELYHSATRESLQQVDIKGTLVQLINSKSWNWELEVIVMHLRMCYATPLYSSRLFLWGLACEDPTRVFVRSSTKRCCTELI